MPDADREAHRLPNANEFSPGQIDLRDVLKLAAGSPGDRPALVEAIRQTYFSEAASRRHDPRQRLRQQMTRANNVLVGMKEYGLFDLQSSCLSPLGETLLKARSDEELHKQFARHILFDCHGFEVIDAVKAIMERQERPTKELLARELEEVHGFAMPRATTRHQILLLWLRKAGLIGERHKVNEEALQEIAGTTSTEAALLSSLTQGQRAFSLTLRELSEAYGSEPRLTKEVTELAMVRFGRVFREDQLQASVYGPLESAGLIHLERRSRGRGGSSGWVAATEKLISLELSLLSGSSVWGVPPELRALLRRPLTEIFADLSSEDTHTKGIALELLALRLSLAIGLTPIRLRERSAETGGAEVDLIAEGAHLQFSRWLFQCKNKPGGAVGVADLAKEIGMAILLRSHVVTLVTTGRFASSVFKHAAELMNNTALQVVLLDRDVLDGFRANGDRALLQFFHKTAMIVMKLKRSQISEDAPAPE